MSVRTAYETGRPRFVLAIEGVRHMWTTDMTLAGTVGDVQNIYSGLIMEGAVLQERAQLREGKTDVSPVSLGVVSAAADREFGRDARIVATLVESLDVADTVATLNTTSAIDEGDHLHIATECVRVVSVDSPTEITIARAQFGSYAQAHATGRINGVGRNVHVYDAPPTLQGRRAWLRVYGATGGIASPWSVAWIGRLSTHPYTRADAATWQLDLDPVTALLDQTIGGIITDEPMALIGAIYSQQSQFCASFVYEIGGNEYEYSFGVVGLFIDESEFLAELQARTDALSMYGVTVTWARTSNGELQMTILVGAEPVTTWRHVVGSPLDGHSNVFRSGWGTASLYVFDAAYQESWTLASDPAQSGSSRLTAITSPTRGVIGELGDHPERAFRMAGMSAPFEEDDDDSVFAFFVVGGLSPAVIGSTVTLEGAINVNERVDVKMTVVDAETGGAANAVVVRPLSVHNLAAQGVRWPDPPAIFYDGQTRATFRFSYGAGTWRDLLTTVISQAPFANAGGSPHLVNDDLDPRDRIASEIVARAATVRRDYEMAKEVALTDVLGQLLLATGVMMRLGANGQIGFAPLVRPADARSRMTIDADTLVTPGFGRGKWPTQRPTVEGVVTQVEIDDGIGTTVVRDEGAVSRFKNRGAGSLEIELPGNSDQPLTVTDAYIIGDRLLAFFALALTEVTVSVGLSARDVRVGDVVTLRSRQLVDPGTGERGASVACVVVGRRWPLDASDAASGELTLLRSPGNVAGYAPSGQLVSITFVEGDDEVQTVDVEIEPNEFTDEDVDTDARHFAAGDVIRLHIVSGGDVLIRGTVVSVSGNVVRVTLDIADVETDAFPAFNGIEFARADQSFTTNQRRYAYVADENGEILDTLARTFG